MHSAVSRVMRIALPFFAAFALTAPVVAHAKAPVAAAKAAAAAPIPWLYRGSDIPIDRAWTFGELANGLRYAVRRNGVPPRQVSVRVAIDAGSLMERPGEGGFAHFNEHLSFRGSKFVADEEAKRVWQRLGATFGSDTNALTSPTQTIYKLDLPSATPEGLEETVKILSGMMSGAFVTPAAVDTERRTVLAELREGVSPQQKIGDATRELFFAGQALGAGSPIGTVETLNAATAASLKAFRDRWYRPDKALVIIAGDADPATFEALIKKYFADWKPASAAPPVAEFGKPDAAAPRAKVMVEPGQPVMVTMAVLRPWFQKNDTVEYNRGKLIDSLALRIVNRRLERAARRGGSFLQASIDQEDVSRSADGTFIQVVPLGADWKAAVRDVRAAIADAMTNPSSQDEIDREAAEFAAALQNEVDTAPTQQSGELADMITEAVNIRETVASPEVARDVFSVMKDRLTPAAIIASTRKLLDGTPMRALLTLPTADAKAEADLLAALTAEVKPGPTTASQSPVNFARVPTLGPPGQVTSRRTLNGLPVTYVTLSNGVNLILFKQPEQVGKVFVNVRFGNGYRALPARKPTVAWAASSALVSSGIADLGQEELDLLTSARRLNMVIDIGEDAFVIRAATRASDLDDQLKLLAAKLERPGWDPAPVNRARAAALLGIDTVGTSAQSALGRELPLLLRKGDARFAPPTRKDIEKLTPEAFRKLWEPLLASGPVEVFIIGDFDLEKAVNAAAATFGAMAPRTVQKARSPDPQSFPPAATPIVRTHRGAADQAAAVLAWPTGGGLVDIYESRKLDILADIFGDRLFDQLREAEGASYTPGVNSSWPTGFNSGGSFVVVAQLKPERIDTFFRIARAVAADFIAKPVTSDELARALTPMRQSLDRAANGSGLWMAQLSGSSTDPSRLNALRTLWPDFARITPADLQASAKRWLVPEKSLALVVVPQKK
jgi:zinc protease